MDKYKLLLRQIKNNNLNGGSYSFVVAQLCVLNNKPYEEMKKAVDNMLASKELQLNASQEIVIDNIQPAYAVSNNKQKGYSSKNSLRLEGKIQGTKGPFAFFIPYDSSYEDVYIKQDNLKSALNGDSVLVEVKKSKRGLEGRVIQILERGTDKVVGKINIKSSYAFVSPDDVKFGKDIYVKLSDTMNAKNGYKVVVKVNRYYDDKKSPEGKVVEVLGAPNKIETEVLSLIRSYNLYQDFPKKVENAAKTVPTEIDINNYKQRKDLTDQLLFTIDGADARDLDDAVSLTVLDNGTRRLGVHIADVGEYVKTNSIIDNEAFKRGTSVYFPGLVLPMLPKNLSNGICSLNEMVYRLALSVFIDYNEKAQVVDYKIYESVIKSKKRFTYSQVDQILQGDKEAIKKYHPFVETLENMNVLAKQLSSIRDKRGAIDFDIPEVSISLNDLGDVLNVKMRQRNDSHRLIEAFMVAANEVVAEHFEKNKLPFVYRIHEKPDAEKMITFSKFVKNFGIVPKLNVENVKPKELQNIINQLQDNDSKYVINRVALRSLKKAKYYPQCLGHFGLASTYYCHFTSPIRRYPDLTIHRIIKHYLRNELSGGLKNATKHFVAISSQVSSEREVEAERLERDVDDLYKTLYMTHHLGEEFAGRISSVTAFGVFVELENTVEGLLRLEDLPADKYEYIEDKFMLQGQQHAYKIGDYVKVMAVRADILSRDIDFILA